jgi:hypothetical protein
MADAPINIILEMIKLFIANTINTMQSLLRLMIDLIGSMFAVSMIGGYLGIFLAVIVLSVVGVVLVKFFFGSVKNVVLLLIVVLVIVVFLILGYFAVAQ